MTRGYKEKRKNLSRCEMLEGGGQCEKRKTFSCCKEKRCKSDLCGVGECNRKKRQGHAEGSASCRPGGKKALSKKTGEEASNSSMRKQNKTNRVPKKKKKTPG